MLGGDFGFEACGDNRSMRGLSLIVSLLLTGALCAQSLEVRNAAGVVMMVDTRDRDPALLVTVPDGPKDERSFKVLLPEHVTVRPRGESEAQHLYIVGQGSEHEAPV